MAELYFSDEDSRPQIYAWFTCAVPDKHVENIFLRFIVGTGEKETVIGRAALAKIRVSLPLTEAYFPLRPLSSSIGLYNNENIRKTIKLSGVRIDTAREENILGMDALAQLSLFYVGNKEIIARADPQRPWGMLDALENVIKCLKSVF
jgi:hypothetical protein